MGDAGSLRSAAWLRWRWGLALAAATGVLVLGVRAVDTDAVFRTVRQMDPVWLLPALLLNLSTVGLWAALWRVLLPPAIRISWRRMVEVTAVTAMMANTVPFLAGHATGMMLLARREKVGEGAAVSVLIQDQLLEGMAKLALLAAVASLAPLPGPLRSGALVVAGLVSVLLVILLVLAWWSAGHHVAPPAGDASKWMLLLGWLRRASGNLVALRHPGIFATGLALALSMKAAEALAILATVRGLGMDVPWWAPLPVLGAVSLAGMVPVAPGNLGIYEGAAFWAWRWLGVDPATAAAAALVHHAVYLVPVVGGGWVLLAWRALWRRGGRDPEEEPFPEETTGDMPSAPGTRSGGDSGDLAARSATAATTPDLPTTALDAPGTAPRQSPSATSRDRA